MRLELFGCCKAEFDELSNLALFGLGLCFFILFLRLPCCAGLTCVGNIYLYVPEETADPTVSYFWRGTARSDCSKLAGQSQCLGVVFSVLCRLGVGED